MNTYIDLLLDSESPEVDTDNPDFSMLPSAENVVGVSVVWANIPNTWSVVDRANGFYVWQALDGSNPDPVEKLFPDEPQGASYDNQSVITQIVTNANSISAGQGYGATINPSTGKLTIYADAAKPFRFAFNLQSSSLADMLGFTTKTTANNVAGWDFKNSVLGQYAIRASQLSAPVQYITSDKAIELAGPTVLSIRSPSVRNTARGHDYKFSTLLNIPTRSLRGQSTVYTNPNPQPVKVNSQSISQFQLRLTLGRRERYWSQEKNRFVSYLSLNKTGYQVVIRLYLSGGPEVMRG